MSGVRGSSVPDSRPAPANRRRGDTPSPPRPVPGGPEHRRPPSAAPRCRGSAGDRAGLPSRAGMKFPRHPARGQHRPHRQRATGCASRSSGRGHGPDRPRGRPPGARRDCAKRAARGGARPRRSRRIRLLLASVARPPTRRRPRRERRAARPRGADPAGAHPGQSRAPSPARRPSRSSTTRSASAAIGKSWVTMRSVGEGSIVRRPSIRLAADSKSR